VWASETYDGTLNDFESFVRGYLMRPERSLAQEPTGPIDAFSYGAALFFRQLDERFGRAIVRELWEQVAASDQRWPSALDSVLRTRHQSSLSQAFADFARWNLYTGRRAAPTVSYANGASYPELTELTVELPYHDDLVRMTPLSARYFVVDVASAATLRIELGSATQDLTGLTVWLASEHSGTITQLSPATATATTAVLPAAAGDRVHVAIADTRIAGDTLRTAVCIAADTATTPCSSLASANPDAGSPPDAGLDALPGAPGSGGDAALDSATETAAIGSGVDASGMRPTTALDSPDAGPGERRAHDGGCSSTGAPGQGMNLLACFALLSFVIARRRASRPATSLGSAVARAADRAAPADTNP
jgi:hypothetical protein